MKNTKILISILSVIILSFISYITYSTNKIILNSTNSEENKKECEIRISHLLTKDSPYGNQVISLNYEVLPSEASDKSVTLKLFWTNDDVNDDINSYLSITHDESNYYIEVEMLQKSNNQAKLTITSKINESISTFVLIDFNQEFLGFSTTKFSSEQVVSLEEGEMLYGEDDFKKLILNHSNGFLGTLPIADKTISNFMIDSYSSVCIFHSNYHMPYIYLNDEFSNLFAEARNSNTTTEGFINDMEEYINTLSNSQKLTLRNSEYITFQAVYNISFNYYGEKYCSEWTVKTKVKSDVFFENIFIDVESINVRGNIIFN